MVITTGEDNDDDNDVENNNEKTVTLFVEVSYVIL